MKSKMRDGGDLRLINEPADAFIHNSHTYTESEMAVNNSEVDT